MARYPKEFSKEASDHVETTRLIAIQKLEQVLTGPPTILASKGLLHIRDLDHCARLECVQTVTLAVASEARKLMRQGTWTVQDVNREVGEYERNFASELKRYDRSGRVSRLTKYSASDRCDVLLPEVELELHSRPEWKAHIADLIAFVNEQAAKSTHTVNEAPTIHDPQPPTEMPAAAARPIRRGYGAEIDAYRRKNYPDFTRDEQLAKRLGVSYDVLKMVKSDKPPSCTPETEKALLDKMGIPRH